MLASSGRGSLNADSCWEGGGKICQNLADVMCEHPKSSPQADFFLKIVVNKHVFHAS